MTVGQASGDSIKLFRSQVRGKVNWPGELKVVPIAEGPRFPVLERALSELRATRERERERETR